MLSARYLKIFYIYIYIGIYYRIDIRVCFTDLCEWAGALSIYTSISMCRLRGMVEKPRNGGSSVV